MLKTTRNKGEAGEIAPLLAVLIIFKSIKEVFIIKA
jgi:hypothetical protein